MKKAMPLAFTLMAIILAGAPGMAYGSASHPFVLQWGQSGPTINGHFTNPQSAAVAPDGSVYVTDMGNTRIQKFAPDGEFLDAWGGKGIGDGHFQSPVGITVGKNSTVYVVDSGLHNVQAFDADGAFILKWGANGNGPGEFLQPSGIATDNTGNIHVVDAGNFRVQEFSPSGVLIGEFGKSGFADGEFVSPTGITIDDAGNIYVSDAGNNAVKKFSPNGNLLVNFDSSIGGKHMRAQGLQSDPDGNLYVADSGNDRILRLDPAGTSIAVWGSSGVQPGQFKMPTDVTLDNAGDLLVVDSHGHRIQKFATPLEYATVEPVVPVQRQVPDTAPPVTEARPAPVLPPVNPVAGDLTKPVITPPNDLVIEATGHLTPVNVGQAIVSDASGIQSLVNNAPARFTLGINTVIWTAIDGAGNMGVATQSVTITDTIPPIIAGIPEITIEAANPVQNRVELTEPAATDVVGILSLENDAPEFFPLGQTVVTWTVSDLVGNTASAAQIINVLDTTAPTIIAPGEIILEAASLDENEVYLGEASVIDNGEIISITNDAPPKFGLGETTVIWLASDASGNIVSAEQIISVIDTAPPEITSPEDIVFEAQSADSNIVDTGLPAVHDIQEVSISADLPQAFPIGDTIITWTATDASGNSASSTQIISVVDTTPPILTVPDDVRIEAAGMAENSVDLGEITAEDVSEITLVSNDAPVSFPFGNTEVIWTVRDAAGNSATALQTVSVVDTVPPRILAPADVTAEAAGPDGASVDPGRPTISDLVEIGSVSNDAPASYPIGMTTITWSASDTSGNTATVTQKIIIVDTIPPQITPPENLTVEASVSGGEALSIGEAAVYDVVGVSDITNDAPDAFHIGRTTVTWSVTDLHGNSAQSFQNVTVVDTTPPSIAAPADIIAEAASPLSNAVEIGTPIANDALGVASISHNAPDVFPVGDTQIIWTITDDAGNTAQATQTVSIVDNIPPGIAAPNDVILEATSADSNVVSLKAADATDAVGVASVSNDAPDAFPVGDTLITWTATDDAGNTATDDQLVSIIDTVPPAVSVPSAITLEASNPSANIVEYGAATATDAVGVTSISNDAPEHFALGLTPITWTATDDAGNTATGVQSIMIIDTLAPIIAVPEDVVAEAVSALENTVDIGDATASDAVSVLSLTHDAPAVFPYGQSTVTWTATDSSGNTATDSQSVTIVDTTIPDITSPPDVTAEAAGSDGTLVDIGVATAHDLLEVSSLISDAPASFLFGQTVVTWTATDRDGNSASGTQLVTVVDTMAPELALPPDIVIDATSLETSIDVGVASAIDLVDSDPSVTGDSPGIFPLGQSAVTWISEDALGNSVSGIQTVDVQACGKPVEYYNIIMGGTEDDIIFGTPRPDLIFALGGDDVVSGSKGNDCIFGGEGDDIIFGQEGNDGITGDDGSDILKGQSGIDEISGGSGLDIIDGGDDNDSCNAAGDADRDVVVKCEY